MDDDEQYRKIIAQDRHNMTVEQVRNEDKQSVDNELICPFEWLTSAASLKPLLEQLDCSKKRPRRALHVGCGSSTLGEYLVTDLDYNQVVNVDKDEHTLQQMKRRWRTLFPDHDDRMVFESVDFTLTLASPGCFDLIVDKSTLDCTLCSDEATAGLLCHVYQNLAVHGYYVVVSFHHIHLLLPLLRDCPGTNWNVQHCVIPRKVEDIVSSKTTARNENGSCCNGESEVVEVETCNDMILSRVHYNNATDTTISNIGTNQTESLGSLRQSTNHNDDGNNSDSDKNVDYRKAVNVFICQRRRSQGDEFFSTETKKHMLDFDKVRCHVHDTNDAWFQLQNPILTRKRHQEMEQEFVNRPLLDLPTCYRVLFTDAEREHLTYEYFMEDWNAFLTTHSTVQPRSAMTLDTAILFLEEMQ